MHGDYHRATISGHLVAQCEHARCNAIVNVSDSEYTDYLNQRARMTLHMAHLPAMDVK